MRVSKRSPASEVKKSWSRSGAGLAMAMCCLTGASACAGRRPMQAPMFTNTPTPVVTAPAVQLPPPQPRVIIAAPPPSAPTVAVSGSEATATTPTPAAPETLKPFTPSDSPLLAHYDSKPHGEAPKVEPEFAPSSRRAQGWQVSSYPYGYYGYSPYYAGGYYGYSPYYGGYYGYPRGLGLGFGLGVGFGLAARPYYGGYYGGGHYHAHGGYYGHGYGGGHAHVSGGHAGRHH